MKKCKKGGRILPKYGKGVLIPPTQGMGLNPPVMPNQFNQQQIDAAITAGGERGAQRQLNTNSAISMGAGVVGGLGPAAIDSFVDPNKLTDAEGNVVASYDKKGAAIGKGALNYGAQGAQMGMMVGGPMGALIGAGVGVLGGGIAGAVGNNKEQIAGKRALSDANNAIYGNRMTRNTGSTIPMANTNMNNYAAHGGTINGPNAEIEDQELVEVPQGTQGVAHNGGNLNQVNSNSYEANGNTHAEGGITTGLPEGTKVYSDQLSIGGKSFAQHVKPINRQIGQIEKRMVATPGNPVLEATLNRLNQRKDQYFNIQESMKPVIDPQQIQEGQTMPMFGGGGTKTRTTNYGPEAITLANQLSKVEGRKLGDSSGHGNGAYGPYGFRESGHLNEWYNNSGTFPKELKDKYKTYPDLWGAYTGQRMDKADVAKMHAQYPYFLMDKTGGNAELASIYNLGGNRGVNAYREAVKNGTLEDFYLSRPTPGNMSYGQYTGKRGAPLAEAVIKPTVTPAATEGTIQQTTNNTSRKIKNFNAGLGYTPNKTVLPSAVDSPANDIPIATPDGSPLYKAKPYGMALTGAAGLAGNAIETNRINRVAPPRSIQAPTFYAGSAPTPIDNSAELAQIGADVNAGRQMLRRGTSGAGMAANLGALNAAKAEANNRVYNAANTINATRRDAFSERQAAAANAGIEAGYKTDVMNNENRTNYNLWKTGAKNAATASFARTIGDVGNVYTGMENQQAGLDAIRKSDLANVGKRRGLTSGKFGGTLKTKRVNYAN